MVKARALLLVAAVVASAVGALLVLGPRATDLPQGDPIRWFTHDPTHALVTAVGVAAWLVLAWLVVVLALCLAAGTKPLPVRLRRAAGRLAWLLTPRTCRRVVEAALGATLLAGPAVTTTAAATPPLVLVDDAGPAPLADPVLDRPVVIHLELSTPPPVPAPVIAPPAPALAPATPVAVAPPSLDRPTTSGAPSAPTTVPAPPDAAVVVRPGDTLWDIAGRHLPAHASLAEILAAQKRWYSANRAVIGPDPDLLLPGQRLVPPG